uniref:THAP-type domain-containing protein n=1 Tax=Anopheles christyi TaxID=43041 RepID=A0A182JS75_9DIPT
MSSTRICILCQNRSNITDQQTDDALDRITYHKFPSNPERLDRWLEFCDQPKETFPKSAYKFLCSSHFAPECFERDMRGELLYGTKRMMLKKDAMPTIRTVSQQLKRNPNPHSNEEEDRKKRKQEVDKLLSGELPATDPIVNPFRKHVCESMIRLERTNDFVLPLHILPPMSEEQMVHRIAELEQQTRSQRNEIVQLQGTIDSKTEKMNFAKAELINVAILLQELKEQENSQVEKRITDILGGRFGEGQMASIMAGPPEQTDVHMKLQVLWTEDELAKTLKLRCISKEAFDYVRQQLRFPLPDAPQLERWIHTIYLETGHSTAAYRLLELRAPILKNVELVCTLNLVRTNTPLRYHYDSKRDQIIGPNAQLHCLTVKGIFSSWQQIVHIEYDLILNRGIVEKTITELHKIGYHVVAITTDCDRDISRTWEMLNVSTDQHYIRHPVTESVIYLYTCPVQTMATIHRILIEDGFVMQENNLVITKANLLAVLTESNAIYQRYLSTETLQEIEKNPNIAREFISPKTTTALRLLAHTDDDEGGLLSTLTTLFDVFIDWYELCMTSNDDAEHNNAIKEQLITELPYGVCEDEQNIVLDGMYDVMESIRCVNSDYGYLPQAVLLSINSMRKLLGDLRVYYPEQVKGLPMLPLSTMPMHGTICKLKESIHRLCPTFRLFPLNEVLLQLCKSIVLAKEDAHVTNLLLEQGNLMGEIPLESLRRPDDPPDPELVDVSEQNACDYLTHLIVARLGQTYDYLGETSMVIERASGQYIVKPLTGDGFACVKPSALWREQAKNLESYVYDRLHEKRHGLANGIIDSILARHPRMGRDLLELYVRTRVAIRVRTLNAQLDATTNVELQIS